MPDQPCYFHEAEIQLSSCEWARQRISSAAHEGRRGGFIHWLAKILKISWKFGGPRAQFFTLEEYFPKHRCFSLNYEHWLTYLHLFSGLSRMFLEWLVPSNLGLMFTARWKTHLCLDRHESILHKNVSILGNTLR